jgi:hypothetical protein
MSAALVAIDTVGMNRIEWLDSLYIVGAALWAKFPECPGSFIRRLPFAWYLRVLPFVRHP